MRKMILFVLIFMITPIAKSVYYDCYLNEQCDIGDFVYEDDKSMITTNVCTLNMTYTNGTNIVTDGTMTANSISYHNYTYTPTSTGTYRAIMFCNSSGDVGYLDRSFRVADISSNVDSITTYVDEINQTVDNIRITQNEGWTLLMRCSDEVDIGQNLMCKAFVLNENMDLENATSEPNLVLYSPDRSLFANNTMEYVSDGVYFYNYTAQSSDAYGTWEAEVEANLDGDIVLYSAFWYLVSSPAEVSVLSVSTPNLRTADAEVIITNEGTADYEYPYEYCIVEDPNSANFCEGSLSSGFGSKYILVGNSSTLSLTLTTPTDMNGTLYFKVIVYYGSRWSRGYKSFVPSLPSVPSGGTDVQAQNVTEISDIRFKSVLWCWTDVCKYNSPFYSKIMENPKTINGYVFIGIELWMVVLFLIILFIVALLLWKFL